MTGHAQVNGKGSIFPYRNGFAAHTRVTKPDGQRQRKYIYGKTREQVHEKWLKLQLRCDAAAAGRLCRRAATPEDHGEQHPPHPH
jgi:hypothetical protein